MADWFDNVGIFLRELGNGQVINEWLKMNESNALKAIEAFVMGMPVERISAMDSTLLTRCNVEFVPDNRTSLVKFYAYFKLAEYVRFDQWRGFPS